jgi:transcriptional regulator with XRE-family HTH domain
MTPDAFDRALAELGWTAADFSERVGVVPNTVWRWRKASVPIPRWVAEYLRAMLALHRLHAEFVAVPGASSSADSDGRQAPDRGP